MDPLALVELALAAAFGWQRRGLWFPAILAIAFSMINLAYVWSWWSEIGVVRTPDRVAMLVGRHLILSFVTYGLAAGLSRLIYKSNSQQNAAVARNAFRPPIGVKKASWPISK